MSMSQVVTVNRPVPLNRQQINARLHSCPRLPSLSTVNSALRELLAADQSYTQQISEVIRRDPSLTARLLRLVNSVYFGLNVPVNSIEEAVFYLGLRQIRQLAMVTPVIEDFQKLAGNTEFPWRDFWRHCIGTAIMAREVLSAVRMPNDEADYVAGLVHDVGKIVMASVFPQHFAEIYRRSAETKAPLQALEIEVLGMDHAELGGLYLEQHRLPQVMIEAARFHHSPERASQHIQIVAAVHVADLLLRHSQIGVSGNYQTVAAEAWFESPAWHLLFPNQTDSAKAIARAGLNRSLERLPMILEGLV